MKKVKVDTDLCITCGACMSTAPDVFGYNDDGTSKVLKDFVEEDDKLAVIACESCPTGAIALEEANDECDCGCDCCDCHEDSDECDCDCECCSCDCNCNEEK